MEEKRINEAESLVIITEMIERSNIRRNLGNGSIMLMWGYLAVIVTAAVWILLAVTGNPDWNWLFYAIPVIGSIATPVMARRQERAQGCKTYADRISNALWTIVGVVGATAIVICTVFSLCGYRGSWNAMFVVALLVVGFGEAIQGAVIEMKAMRFGGAIGMLAGLALLCAICAGVPLSANWVLPLFIVAFICMMIIPGHILNCKTR